MSLPTALAVLACVTSAFAGDPPIATGPAIAPPSVARPVSLTVVRLSEIHGALCANGEEIGLLGAHVQPREPGLVLKDAPPGEHERVLARLKQAGPLIDSIVKLSNEPLGELPPYPSTESGPGVGLAHPATRLLNLSRLLLTDAGRCWDEGDFNGAADRIAATLRWARQLLDCDDATTRSLRGNLTLIVALARLDAQTAGGLSERLDAAHRVVLVDLLGRFDPTDPLNELATWETKARGYVAFARQNFSGGDAGKKLADYIDEHGANTDAIDSTTGTPKGIFDGTIPVRRNLDKIRAMSSAEIARHIDTTEAMIAKMAEGLRSSDPIGALKPLQAQVAADPSQVGRIILDSPAATFNLTRTLRSTLGDCAARLKAQPK